MAGQIPLVSCTDDDFDTLFLDACRSIGFVALTHHGIAADLLTEMRQLCERLFAIEDERKRQLMIEPSNYRGFIPLGFFTPNRSEVNGAQPDMYEGFKLHWECPTDHPARGESHLYGCNRWLPEISDMQRIVTDYWHACDQLAGRLMRIVCTHLDIDEDHLTTWFAAPLTNMTLLHYPAALAEVDRSSMHPHKDTNVLTILAPDPAGGLQVRDRAGEWIEAAPEWPALIVNIGEMLELWSGGEFIATPHRAANDGNASRYAFPWFMVPSHDVVVEPLVPCIDGYHATAMPVGELSAEVWRTNWPNEEPGAANFDLGSLDRQID